MGMSGTIEFSCGTCGKAAKVPVAHAGKKGKCGGCGSVFRVPAPAAEEQGRCEGCGKALAAGYTRCKQCAVAAADAPTPGGLLRTSLGFVVVGLVVSMGFALVDVYLWEQGGVMVKLCLLPVLVGVVAVIVGSIDLVRALMGRTDG